MILKLFNQKTKKVLKLFLKIGVKINSDFVGKRSILNGFAFDLWFFYEISSKKYTTFTKIFVGIGLDNLSLQPSSIWF